MILLITTQESAMEAVRSALPFPIPVVSLATVSDSYAWLQAQTDPPATLELILIEAGTGERGAAACRELRAAEATRHVPLIALITQVDERQIVLAAGANDYLLMPLLPAELKVRLTNHLQVGRHSLDILAKTFDRVSVGASSEEILNQAIQRVAQLFNAPAAWLLLLNTDKETVELVGSYNLPPLFRQNSKLLDEEILTCMEVLEQKMFNSAGQPAYLPKMIHCPFLARADKHVTNGLTHHLSIPLEKDTRLIGILNLAYLAPFSISSAEQEILAFIGRHFATLLAQHRLQQETQLHATQTAFIVLLARMLSQRVNLTLILSLTLEQAVALLNASLGEIWLVSTDGQRLELASGLTSLVMGSLGNEAISTSEARVAGQGLIGWVAQESQTLCTYTPASEPGFDPMLDQFKGLANFAMLAVPLVHHEKTIGVLAVYSPAHSPFHGRDVALLEGIAGLVASAIANARLVEELRNYGEQQRGLYEMSQQIAAGLDLPSTLNRTLYWTSRLLDTEVGLLWLADEAGYQLELVSMLGLEALPEQPLVLPVEGGLCGWVVQHGEALIINNPDGDARINCDRVRQLGIEPRNALVVPISYNGQPIGVLSLLNKVGSPFNEADKALLTTAAEIIAVAITNARLHTQTVTLMTERERLHQQVLQTERLAIIGRLTASLSHEINNPMQAIQGALALALEELNDPEALTTYISMSQRESERVVQLINRLREIYRPADDQPEPINLNQLVQEAGVIVRKELANQRVKLRPDFAADLPPIRAIASQIHLVLLNLLLDLSQAIGQAGGGELSVRSYRLPSWVCLEFSTHVSFVTRLNWTGILRPGSRPNQPELGFDVSLSHDIILAHGGTIRFDSQDQRAVYTIELPISQPAPFPDWPGSASLSFQRKP